MLCRIVVIITLVFTCLHANAQFPVPGNESSNIRSKHIPVAADSMIIDTISIVPGSLMVEGFSDTSYILDHIKAILYWKKRPEVGSVHVRYRVFPFTLNPVAQRMRYDSIMNNFYVKPIQTGVTGYGQRGIFDFGTLKAEGSFGRQLGFGNSQDAVLNSSMNLQLSGMLSDSIEVQAAITDNNIPIQPDGTTQQLNEFDQVFLQFKKGGWQLSLGDIDIRQSSTYFLNFYKRLQGISFQTINRIGPRTISKTLVSGSIAKGKFHRNVFSGLEGNQGPYRLNGANNEIFFIVLANTERVFLDGELLQRGEDQDYVINYNSAELTFTPRRMITKDSRIQVEFEYADRNFLNANLYGTQEFHFNEKLKLRLGVFQNSDAKNSQINQVLDTKQTQFLSQLGDSIHRAFYPAASLDSFATDKILYEKVYIGADSFYRYSTDPLLARYSLSFVDVGQNMGDYVPDFNGANGKVFKYVAPIAGVKQGRYEPVQILVTPKKQQIVNLGLDYDLAPGTWIKTEVATSNKDENTFSKIDDGDDRGWAVKMQFNRERPVKVASAVEFLTMVDYEFVQKKFKPLERLRNVEFSRDWGLPIISRPVDEQIIRSMIGLRNRGKYLLTYQLINYHRSDKYDGFQHQVIHNGNMKGWLFNNQAVVTHYSSLSEKGKFWRPVIDISKQLKQFSDWRIGFRYALENNDARYRANDSLLPTAFSFDTYSVYLRTDEAKKNRFGITFFTRSDKYPIGKNFVRGDRSLNLNLQTALLANPKRQLYFNTTFRRLKVYDASFSKLEEDETILGRAEYVMNEWKGLLNGNVLYEVGAGQEQRRDFAYLEVPAGTGQYAWIDYNSDGTQQLNEFELAIFPDQARFIRVFTPTNEFVKANFITFNYSLQISPRSVLNRSDLRGIEKFISRLNLVTSLQVTKKSLARGHFEFNPFKYGVNDTALVVMNNTLLNTISFNRFSSKWGIDLSNLRSNGKSLLTYGYESRSLDEWMVKSRWNIGQSFSINLQARKGTNALYTPQFANRNYELDIYSAEPMLVFIKGTRFRLLGSYKYEKKKNLPLYGNEVSSSNSFNTEAKYNLLQSASFTGRFTLDNIDYNAAANTTVSYIMLNGLLPGKNYLWSLGFSKRLMNNLELNFQYDGRKAGVSNTIHVGRAGLTALF